MTSRDDRPLERWIRLARLALVAFGLFSMIAAAFAQPLGLSASSGLSSGKALLFLLGSVALSVGVLGRRIAAAYKGLAVILLNTLVLLALLEVVLFAHVSLRSAVRDEGGAEAASEPAFVDGQPLRLSYYRQQDWVEHYVEEYEAAWSARSLPYEPYVIWRNQPFEGNTIHIDEQGFRVTPGAECSDDALLIFLFGGSTMWGTGVPDHGTIATHLQELLAQRHERPVCVSNRAEQAWVSTQSVIQLLHDLREGQRPDVVVFYDGINDVFSSYQSGEAGMPQNLSRLRARFQDRPENPPLLSLASRLRSFRLARRWVTGPESASPAHAAQVDRRGELARETVGVYRGNAEIVRALGSAFGFDAVFFWQPLLLLEEKELTEEETWMRELTLSVHPEIEPFFRSAYGEAGGLSQVDADIYDLSKLFSGEEGLVYVDPWHVTSEANRKVARAILAAIDDRISAFFQDEPAATGSQSDNAPRNHS